MDWLFFGRSPDLTTWQSGSFSNGVEKGPSLGDRRDNHEREVAMEEPGSPAAKGPFRRLAEAILSFDVFPPYLATPVLARAPIQVGDAVGLSYRLLPGCRLFFAARVYERFDRQEGDLWRVGFSYRTLQGHPMCGDETFVVEKNLTTGRIVVALRSWSRTAHWTTFLGYPLARRWQIGGARAALDHLQQLASAK